MVGVKEAGDVTIFILLAWKIKSQNNCRAGGSKEEGERNQDADIPSVD